MFKVGDRVVAPMHYGYASVHGVIEKIWTNEYGVEMASVNHGNIHKIDWMGNWHRHVPVDSLELDRKEANISVIDNYRKMVNQQETAMETLIDRIIAEGELVASVSYSKPGDDRDELWHIDTYVCEDRVWQIEYTDYMYVDLKLLGTTHMEV